MTKDLALISNLKNINILNTKEFIDKISENLIQIYK